MDSFGQFWALCGHFVGTLKCPWLKAFGRFWTLWTVKSIFLQRRFTCIQKTLEKVSRCVQVSSKYFPVLAGKKRKQTRRNYGGGLVGEHEKDET